MTSRTALRAALGVALLVLAPGAAATAQSPARTTCLTFTDRVQVPGAELSSGT